MIIIQLLGGLGNQMFQYATAYAIASENKTKLKIDTFYLRKRAHNPLFTKRDYSLFVFRINSSENINLAQSYFYKILLYLSRKNILWLKGKYKVIKEKKYSFDKGLLSIKDNCYLIGYFQSEKYFKKYSVQLRQIFHFSDQMDLINQHIADKISSQNSVSIHIRRGDYLSNKLTNSIHGLCNNDYYLKAIDHIKKNVQDPVFYIFSDDIGWATLNIVPSANTIYIGNNSGINSYRDMQLMSLCKHNIIANSSFSWWAAWLNTNIEKIVISPKNWFFDNVTNSNTGDLIPENWLRI